MRTKHPGRDPSLREALVRAALAVLGSSLSLVRNRDFPGDTTFAVRLSTELRVSICSRSSRFSSLVGYSTPCSPGAWRSVMLSMEDCILICGTSRERVLRN